MACPCGGDSSRGANCLSDNSGRREVLADDPSEFVGPAEFGLPLRLLLHVMGGAALLGMGTAMVYPALIAVVGDAAAPDWRARSLSVYRFSREPRLCHWRASRRRDCRHFRLGVGNRSSRWTDSLFRHHCRHRNARDRAAHAGSVSRINLTMVSDTRLVGLAYVRSKPRERCL